MVKTEAPAPRSGRTGRRPSTPDAPAPFTLGPCDITDAEFTTIRELIYEHAGISLSESKRALVCSRLAKRLRLLELRSLSEYLVHLEERDADGKERQQMVNCLTTNKTDFFREPHHFDFLREKILPQIRKRADEGGPRRLRIWSAGCSIGHEPYSTAITILESFSSLQGWDIGILASDINTEVLATAKQGIYPIDQLEPVPEEIRRKYFLRGRGEWAGQCQVRPEVRRLVTFRQINLMEKPWPFGARFDLIFCRNVIIYFNTATQQVLTTRLAEQLTDGGYLMLGHSEHPPWLSSILTPVGQTIYRRERSGAPATAGARGAASLKRGKASSAAVGVRRPGPSRPAASRDKHDIIAGEYFATTKPTRISTLLGSCVAACLYDPVARIGGMNHFLLPYHTGDEGESARYGLNAMELLINEIMKLGGDRRRLQAKVFGGGNVLRMESSRVNVGERNSRFVVEFLETERIPLIGQRLGGERPLRVHFLSATGQAFVKALPGATYLAERETLFSRQASQRIKQPEPESVILF